MAKLGRPPKGKIDQQGRECSHCGIYKIWDEYPNDLYSSNKKHSWCKDCLSRKGQPEYIAWLNMRARCFNQSVEGYGNWGGRGITVCLGWSSFDSFLQDVGPKPIFPIRTVLDRINNEGNYSCGHCQECKAKGWILNVRWCSYSESNKNRRRWAKHL